MIAGKPSTTPAYTNVSLNLFISNYNSFDGIDNDDGSSYYDINHNVFYMGEGLKSDYHGHSKRYHHNINIGAGVCCFQFGFISGRAEASNVPSKEYYQPGHIDMCYSNQCIQRPGGSWLNGASVILWGCNSTAKQCHPPGAAMMSTFNNTVYREAARRCAFKSGCDVACGMGDSNQSMLSIAEFQRKCGQGMGSTVQPMPTAAAIVDWSGRLLDIPHSS